MWACVTGAKKGKREEGREREKVDGGREGKEYLSFSPQSPLPFSLFLPTMFRRLSRRLNNVYHFCDLFKETPVRSGFTPKAKKKCNYNLYAARSRQPNEPELWGSCLDIRWRLWFLRWSFLIWTFLYRSLSSRSLYASGYSHVNKTHFHKKGLTLLITSRYFGSRKGPILSWRNGILFVVLSGADWGRCKRLDSLRAGFRHRCGFWLDEIFFLEESKNSVSKNTDSFAVYTCNCLSSPAVIDQKYS